MANPRKEVRVLVERTPPAQMLELALEMLGVACAALKHISRERPTLRIAIAIFTRQTLTRLNEGN